MSYVIYETAVSAMRDTERDGAVYVLGEYNAYISDTTLLAVIQKT